MGGMNGKVSLIENMAWHKTDHKHAFNSPTSPSGAYMRQGTGPLLVGIMACRLFGSEPLSKSFMTFH